MIEVLITKDYFIDPVEGELWETNVEQILRGVEDVRVDLIGLFSLLLKKEEQIIVMQNNVL